MKSYKDYLFVEVPEGAKDFQIGYEYRPFCVWLYGTGLKFPYPIGNAIYPAKKAEILGMATEVEWEGIVEGFEDSDTWDSGTQYSRTESWTSYMDYEEQSFEFRTAKESAQSLIKSLGLENFDRILVLKKT